MGWFCGWGERFPQKISKKLPNLSNLFDRIGVTKRITPAGPRWKFIQADPQADFCFRGAAILLKPPCPIIP
jgi:hypothetical protein